MREHCAFSLNLLKALIWFGGILKFHRARCRHGAGQQCIHCCPLNPFDERVQQNAKVPVKFMSFHTYLKKLTSGADRYVCMSRSAVKQMANVLTKLRPPYVQAAARHMPITLPSCADIWQRQIRQPREHDVSDHAGVPVARALAGWHLHALPAQLRAAASPGTPHMLVAYSRPSATWITSSLQRLLLSTILFRLGVRRACRYVAGVFGRGRRGVWAGCDWCGRGVTGMCGVCGVCGSTV